MRQNPVATGTFLSLFGGMVLLVGCADNQIGRPCNTLNKSPTSGVSFVNPAPDCPTRLCMVTPPPAGVNPGAMGHADALAICTAECQTDQDCETAQEFKGKDRCTSQSYVCAVPSVVPGEDNFCCKKLCVCKDDLIPGFNTDGTGVAKLPRDDNNVAIPSACSGTKRDRTCRLATK